MHSSKIKEDATPAIRAALEKCRESGAPRLVLPKATYHFFPALACEEYLFISNNDEGLKRIAFFLDGFEDFEIDGQGSLFIFHGFMLPFFLRGCRGVALRNLRIDWHRTFHSEAVVRKTGEDFVDIEISPAYPHRVERGQLTFQCEEGRPLHIDNILEFDSKRRETAFKANDNFGIGGRHRASQLDSGLVRFHAAFSEPRPQAGNVLAFIDEGRHCPAITISGSRDVLLEEVTIHHCGGMGVIAQLSRDVTLRKCMVTPAPDSGRMISLRADATHFVCCGGHIVIEDCEFSHQLDDPGNFHNVFTPVVRRLTDHSLIVRLQHSQQCGLELYGAGHEVEFVKAGSLARESRNELAGVKRLNREHIHLDFLDPLPGWLGPGWSAGSLHWVADVTVRRTRVHSNRARGFLVTTGGKALFEENYFHNAGAAILIEGDAEFWYEAGAVEDVLIRRNVFDHCNYGVWGRATIDINPGIAREERPRQRFHRNIRIEENEFRTFHSDILRAHCVDGLTVRGNTILLVPGNYPASEPGSEWFIIEECSAVDIRDNAIPMAEEPLLAGSAL